jgi:hypothetical protein
MVVHLVAPPTTPNLAIPIPNRAPTKSTMRVSPTVLIGVLVVVFPDVQDSDPDLVVCTFLEDKFDGGLIFFLFYVMELHFVSLARVNCLFVCLYRIPRLRFVPV